jgi:hypothetical protein
LLTPSSAVTATTTVDVEGPAGSVTLKVPPSAGTTAIASTDATVIVAPTSSRVGRSVTTLVPYPML